MNLLLPGCNIMASTFQLRIVLPNIILLGNLCFVSSNSTQPSVSGGLESQPQNVPTNESPQPNLNPDPQQTMQAVGTIYTSSRKDILVWRTELLETQKYFNKLKVQNYNEEKMTKTEDSVFRQWVDKTEERLSRLLGAMTTRLNTLDKEPATRLHPE